MPTITKPKKTNRAQEDNIARKERIKVYNSVRWRRLREIKLATDPLCEVCLEQRGRTVAAEDVHHRVSFMSTTDPDMRRHLAYDYSNLQSLCKQCHQKIHNSNEFRR